MTGQSSLRSSPAQQRASRICGRWNRRAFLGGAAVMLPLPFLESLAAADGRAKRALWMFMPNGMWMAEWGPGKETLKALDAFRGRYALVTGLANKAATLGPPGSHAQGTGCWLTCVKIEHEVARAGISADQVAAKSLGKGQRIASLQVGAVAHYVNHGDGAYKLPTYHNHISWASATQPLEPVSNPKTIFDRLFSGFDPGLSHGERLRRLKTQASVLDYVRQQSHALASRLSNLDKAKLDEFMTSVREIENEVTSALGQQTSSGAVGGACGQPAVNLAGEDLASRSKTINALIALAFQCDVTRVVSHMISKPQDGEKLFRFVGRAGNHHNASHDPSAGALMPIDRWHVEQVADLMARLHAIDEGGGRSVLDNTALVFGNELSDGERHSRSNIPVLVAGGLFKTDAHVNHTGTLDELHLTALHATSVLAESFGTYGRAPIRALLPGGG